MALQDVHIVIGEEAVPADVQQVLTASHSGVSKYLDDYRVQPSGFVPSNPELVYFALRTIIDSHCYDGKSFCEWGSGYGTATCLAAILGFDACGIEIEPNLVAASTEFAGHFELPAVFAQGSFVPTQSASLSEEAFRDTDGRYPWLKNKAASAYRKLGRDPDSFDVVFAYPWPGEEYFVTQLFDSSAAPGALLLRYSDNGEMTLLRKTVALS